ncbi:MAG: GNAT family N-acetyltransferase, partial [Pseudomonadota bacterium]
MIFSSLFGGGSGRGPVLEPMQADDVRQVLSLIEEHDEDDAEEAEERFRDSLDGMFVLKEGPRVVGVTGAWRDPGVADVFWLSWTYLAEDKKGHGLGQAMIDQLGEMLMGEGCRKVFISTSDYVDEDGDDVYAEARAFYEGAMGASLEIRIDNYFDVGEAQLIYSAHFGAPDGAEEADEDADAEPMGPVIFDGLAQAPETDDGLALTWRALEAGDAVPDGDLVP